MIAEKPMQLPAADVIARHCKLSDPAQALLARGQPADAYIALLQQNQLLADAIRFMAYRLPRREAVWWGALCLWEADRVKPSAPTMAALQAVVDWLRDPTEDTRRSTEAAAAAAGLEMPSGNLAYAVFFTGGSLSAPELPEVVPDPQLTPKMIANAVLLASWSLPADQSAAMQRRFLSMAGEVLRNGAGCPPLAKP